MKASFGILTYKTHIDKTELREFLGDLHKGSNMGIAHETGDETNPYPHTHVVIDFGKSITISKKRVQSGWDFGDIHPNWKVLKGRKAFNDGLRYISKEDTDIGIESPEPQFADIVEAVWECESERDVLLRVCKGREDVIPYLMVFKYKLETERHIAYQDTFKDAELNEYQTEWWDRLRVQNDRQILWIYDEEGGKGKSWFGKWLRVNHNAERMILKQKAVGFMYKGSEYVYVNITRTTEDFVSYAALEDLKDGEMVSDKYEGRSVLYAPPKVIVFSNFYPKISAMTTDRWDIIEYD